jgi:hypothetical protein
MKFTKSVVLAVLLGFLSTQQLSQAVSLQQQSALASQASLQLTTELHKKKHRKHKKHPKKENEDKQALSQTASKPEQKSEEPK